MFLKLGKKSSYLLKFWGRLEVVFLQIYQDLLLWIIYEESEECQAQWVNV